MVPPFRGNTVLLKIACKYSFSIYLVYARMMAIAIVNTQASSAMNLIQPHNDIHEI